MVVHGSKVIQRLTTLGPSFAALYFVEEAVYESITGIDEFVLPPFDKWPGPKHSMDLIPETSFGLLMHFQKFTTYTTSAAQRCVPHDIGTIVAGL